MPLSLKLFVAVPPRYRSLKGALVDPKSIVVEPGSNEVLIATEDRLLRLVLAYDPAAW